MVFPESVTKLGEVLAVCNTEKLINPLFLNKRLSDTVYIISPRVEDLFYREKAAAIGYTRKVDTANLYYLRLNEVQISLEDPFFMALLAPDDIYTYQTPNFMSFKESFEASLPWSSIIEETRRMLINLMDSYYTSNRLYTVPDTIQSTCTDMKDNNYAHLSTVLTNIFRLTFKFEGRPDWFWNNDLVNMGVMYYLSARTAQANLKYLLTTLSDSAKKINKASVQEPKDIISKFLFENLLKEKN